MDEFKVADSHLGRKGCAGMYCCANRGPGEAAEGPPGLPDNPGAPGLTMGKQVCWLRRMSPCMRLGIGCRAVKGVLGSGRGGLL